MKTTTTTTTMKGMKPNDEVVKKNKTFFSLQRIITLQDFNLFCFNTIHRIQALRSIRRAASLVHVCIGEAIAIFLEVL